MRAGTNPSPRIIATSALDHLYQIDNPAELKECLNDFLTAVKGSFRTLSKKDEDALIAAVTTGEKPISPELYQRYADNFRRAVDAVPIDDTDLSAQWHANVSRFAAYKAYHATEELRRIAEDEDGDMAFLRATLHKYNRYQAAEYNTAIARARTGKQWLSFNDPDNARLFPYIEWLPSRSATPREAHRIFWNCRWPKGDPFWKENQPGTLWNCKCDWQETDEEPDPQKNKTALDKAEEMKQIAAEANKPNPLCLPGLDKNPATSGQIFTDSAPYITKAPADVATFAIRTERDLFRNAHADDFIVFRTDIGKVLFDKITSEEISKGAKTDISYFYKLEIAQHFDKYADKLQLLNPNEPIDLSHNNHNNIFYRRKAQFECMEVYKLTINGYAFQIKLGRFKSGGYNLYCITEP